jgi:hypothetical protein
LTADSADADDSPSRRASSSRATLTHENTDASVRRAAASAGWGAPCWLSQMSNSARSESLKKFGPGNNGHVTLHSRWVSSLRPAPCRVCFRHHRTRCAVASPSTFYRSVAPPSRSRRPARSPGATPSPDPSFFFRVRSGPSRPPPWCPASSPPCSPSPQGPRGVASTSSTPSSTCTRSPTTSRNTRARSWW